MARKEKPPKKVKKKPVKPQKPQKPAKAPKMQSSAPRRFGAWVLVIFMISMIAFGVFKVLRSPTEQGIEKTIENQMENLDNETLARTKAVSFAERFATDYFTFSQGEDYAAKMAPYCASGVAISSPAKRSQVLYVGTGRVEVEGSQVNVDVLCRIAYATNDETFDMIQFATIRVPVKVDKSGDCAVVALPIYVGNNNNPSRIESVMSTIDGEDGKEIDAIKTTIENFFRVYYNGTPSELKYYVTKNYGQPVTTGLDIEVTDISSQVKASGDKWDAECTIKIDNNGVEQTQHCFLEIVKGAESRYYINKLYTMN